MLHKFFTWSLNQIPHIPIQIKNILEQTKHNDTLLSDWIGCFSLKVVDFDDQIWFLDIRYAFGSAIFKQHLIDFIDFNPERKLASHFHYAKDQKLILYICADDLEFPNSYSGFELTKSSHFKENLNKTIIWHPIPEHYLIASNYRRVYRGLIPKKLLSEDLVRFFLHTLNTHSIAGFKHFATTQNSLPNFTTPISPSVGDSFQYTFSRNIYRKAEGGRRLLFDELNSYKPNLTVITVVFNNVKLIEQTIQSVINQQGSGLEYILIDGGSTDGTIELIQKYNEQLTYWISEPDCGISEAFNKAISLTRNCWINFMNSGDYFLRLDILSFLEKSRNQNKIISGFCRSDGFWLPSKILNNQQCITRRAKLSHQATFIEKSLFTQYGVFDTRFQSRMDYHFWMKVLPYEKFFFIKENIAYYQKVGESNKNLLRMYKEELIINFESLPFSYFLIRSILIIGAFFYKTFVSRYR